MVFTLTSTTSYSDHLDLLRHLIDFAALADRRTALKLAVLSKTTQAWVEPIIYAEVNLRHESCGRAFLSTVRNSKIKPPSFFAQYVRSLVISSDFETQLIVEILSVCRGIVNFSYWATPSYSVRQPLNQRPISMFDEGAGHNGSLNEVAPQRMSVLLHENHIYPLKPHFNLVFFSRVTHLSILNNWTEWTTWTHICSDAMPALTHIKFDLNSRPSNMGIQTCHHSEFGITKNLDSCDEISPPESLLLEIKLSRVAKTLSEVLNNTQTLCVCILVLRFDTDPSHTAKVIARLTSKNLPGTRVPAKTDVSAVNWFDSRLVFAHEREPFRYSHAHSQHEMKLWKSAETIVNSQRYVTGYTLLDCDGSTCP